MGFKVTPPYQQPNLFVHGIGVEYPPHSIKPEELATLAKRFYPSSPAYVKRTFPGQDEEADV